MKMIDGAYQPLRTDVNEIRLLTLQPAVDKATKLVGTVDKVELSHRPEYEAVSWCWGEPANAGSMVLNSMHTQIRKNLENALRHFRFPDRPRILWVDAICVNQAATLERQHQVRLMGEIYKAATRTLVWLHAMESRADQFAFETWKRLGHGISVQQIILEKAGLWSSQEQSSFEELEDVSEMLDANDKSHCAKLLGQLRRFFDYEWWSRLWVLQEVALASEVQLFVGSDWMDFTHLVSACNRLWNEYRNRQTEFDTILGRNNRRDLTEETERKLGTAQHINSIYRRICGTEHAMSRREMSFLMIEVLAKGRNRHAKIDHDKIYGLLGLIPPDLLEDFPLSYDEAAEQVFYTTAYQLLNLSKSFILFNCIREGRTERPSWCPTWSYAYFQRQDFYLRARQENLFQACGTSPWHVNIIEHHSGIPTLEVRGFRLDVICRQKGFAFDLMDAADLYLFLESCVHCVDHDLSEIQRFYINNHLDQVRNAKYITGVGILEAVARIALNDCEPTPEDHQIQRLGDSNSRKFEEWLATVDLNGGMNSFQRDVMDASEEMSFEGIASQSICQFVRSVTSGKSFFTTKLGYAGLADDDVPDEGNSEVWILAGGSHPVILEPTEGGYTVCSEAYVHGVMDGEATRGEVPVLPRNGDPRRVLEECKNGRDSWPSPVFRTIHLL